MNLRRCAVALAAALLLPGASAPEHPRHPWTQPGHLRIGVVRTTDNLNPLLSGTAATTDVAQFVFDGLIRFDDRGEPIPDAATVVPTRENGGISADGKTITYHLRSDVKFSDGAPLTADDVLFTFEQDVNPHNNVPYHFPYDQASSVVAKDPHTVVVRLREPSAPFVSNFFRNGVQGSILPKHLLAGKPDLNQDPYNLKPIGSGPFMIEKNEPNQSLELVPNPHWFGGKPGLSRVTYRIIPSENTLLVALRTHEIDFYYAAPEQQYRLLRELSDITTSAKPNSNFEMVSFNARSPLLSDVRMRRAIAAAIDWKTLARTTYLDVDLVDWGDMFPHSWAYTPQPDANAYDPAKARALLDALGWKTGADGIRTKDGKRLELQIATVVGVTTRENAEIAIQQWLHAAGIELSVRNAPANLLFAPYGAGGLLATGKYDLGIYGWTKNPDPDDSQTIGPGYVPPHGANYTGVADDEIGRLQKRANATYDRAARKALYAQLERRFGEIIATHTIVWRANIDAWNDDLHGVRPAQAVSDFWNVGSWSL
ncbi:MAG TPA: peptide ABC transporter substrate-binding protein [Candidatus Elarobacter sp.]